MERQEWEEMRGWRREARGEEKKGRWMSRAKRNGKSGRERRGGHKAGRKCCEELTLVRKAQIPSPLQKPSHRLSVSTGHHGALSSKAGFVGASHSQTITVGKSKAELKTFWLQNTIQLLLSYIFRGPQDGVSVANLVNIPACL